MKGNCGSENIPWRMLFLRLSMTLRIRQLLIAMYEVLAPSIVFHENSRKL